MLDLHLVVMMVGLMADMMADMMVYWMVGAMEKISDCSMDANLAEMSEMEMVAGLDSEWVADSVKWKEQLMVDHLDIEMVVRLAHLAAVLMDET